MNKSYEFLDSWFQTASALAQAFEDFSDPRMFPRDCDSLRKVFEQEWALKSKGEAMTAAEANSNYLRRVKTLNAAITSWKQTEHAMKLVMSDISKWLNAMTKIPANIKSEELKDL